MTASRTTPVMEARTKTDWSPIGFITSSGGTVSAMRGKIARIPLTTDSVDALPDFRMVTRRRRRPSCRTILVWGMLPSATVATSWM